MAGSNSYGFVGVDYPTQDTSNSGVLTPQEILQLREEGQFQEVTFDVDFLIVAGGGGGGASTYGAGGGGAGGYLNSYSTEQSGANSTNLAAHSTKTGTFYTVTVGAGGGVNVNGSDSVFSDQTAVGGGRGSSGAGVDGGSAGGRGRQYSAAHFSGQPVENQGHQGGGGYDSGVGGGPFAGGGGGGTQSVGGNASGSAAGNGGQGEASSITGTSVTRAAGGGGFSGDGSGGSNRTHGTGGSSIGGSGGNAAGSGTVNTGSGGGASYDTSNAGSGGSGIVILRFSDAYEILEETGTLVSSTSTDGSDTVVQFTAGDGTIIFDEV